MQPTPSIASAASSSFAAAFAAFSSARPSASPWLHQRREKAFADFVRLGLPTRQQEDWRYTSLRPLAEAAFTLPTSIEIDPATYAAYLRADELTLVLVDGRLLAPLPVLPAGLKVTPLAEAVEHQAVGALRLLKHFSAGQQPFTQLSDAFLADGLCLEWAPDSVQTQRLHLVHISSGQGATAQFPRHLLSVGANAKAEVIETFITAGPAERNPGRTLTNALTDIELAPGAVLSHSRCQLEGSMAVHIGRLRAHLAANAQLKSLSLSAGSKLARVDIEVVLNGEGSEVALDGLYLTNSKQHCDHHTLVEHRVPKATSRQLYKGILADESRAVFNGVVRVHRDAQQTAAFQLNRNLLLSSEAEVDTKPELQIDADDVKCAHGASVGQLNDEQLFYLESRGLAPDLARRLLVQAFADEVMLRVPHLYQTLRPLTMRYFL